MIILFFSNSLRYEAQVCLRPRSSDTECIYVVVEIYLKKLFELKSRSHCPNELNSGCMQRSRLTKLTKMGLNEVRNHVECPMTQHGGPGHPSFQVEYITAKLKICFPSHPLLFFFLHTKFKNRVKHSSDAIYLNFVGRSEFQPVKFETRRLNIYLFEGFTTFVWRQIRSTHSNMYD